MEMLKALIFDFDGLILDTETPEFQVWQAIYREYGHELPAEEWGKIIGGYGLSSFDAAEHLVQLAGGAVDAYSLRSRHRAESARLVRSQSALPGVVDLMREARSHGLALAIASSSDHEWVEDHLSLLDLPDRFDEIICGDDVAAGRTKPNPDLYLRALDVLHIRAGEAIAFEDSHNGVRAAQAAGIFVVAVPNSVTSLLGVDGADLTLKSLKDFHLADFLSGR